MVMMPRYADQMALPTNDGGVFAAPCPRCGRVITVTAPSKRKPSRILAHGQRENRCAATDLPAGATVTPVPTWEVPLTR